MLELRLMVNGRPAMPMEIALAFGRDTAMQALGDYIEALISAVDQLAGDPDLEDDDSSGDPLDRGEDEPWRPHGVVLPQPLYGEDQRTGPLNEKDAVKVYYAAMRA